MALEYGTFGHGGVVYPLTTSTANSLLRDQDPSLFYALDYFQSVITTYLGSRILAEAARAPAIPGITAAVAAVTPVDPAPYLTEEYFPFPLLAAFRRKEKYTWKVQSWMEDSAEWTVAYILPPLTGGQAERMLPVLRGVGQVILNRIEAMKDPGYQSGLEVWKAAGLETVALDEASYGAYAGMGNLVFPAWTAKLTVKERDMPVTGAFAPLGGIDLAEDAPDVADVVDAQITLDDLTKIGGVTGVWLDTLALSGSSVTQWTDLSGNARHFTPFPQPPTKTISNATAGAGGQIQLTILSSNVGAANDSITVSGVLGTTEANGTWPITPLSTTTLLLNGSTFVHAYTSGGSYVNNTVRTPTRAAGGCNGHDCLALTPTGSYQPGIACNGPQLLRSTVDLASLITAQTGLIYTLVNVTDVMADLATGSVVGALTVDPRFNDGIWGTTGGGLAIRKTGSVLSAIGTENTLVNYVSTSIALGSWQLVTWRHVNSKVGVRVGGIKAPFEEVPSGDMVFFGQMLVGVGTFGTGANPSGFGMHGFLGGMATFGRALTDAEDAIVVGFFKNYGNLTL